jgi:hypothetical protein
MNVYQDEGYYDANISDEQINVEEGYRPVSYYAADLYGYEDDSTNNNNEVKDGQSSAPIESSTPINIQQKFQGRNWNEEFQQVFIYNSNFQD